MNKIKDKSHDCLEFKYEAQEKIFKEIKNLSIEEEKEYFNRKVKQSSFNDFIELIKSNSKEENHKILELR